MAIAQNIYLAVDMIVHTKDRKLLLIKRKNPPFVGTWAFPGGFVEDDEDLVDAAARELEEETLLKLSIDQFKQFRSYGTPKRDPRFRTVSVVYSAQLSSEVAVKGADDAAEAKWFEIDSLPELAFDHRQIIDEFLSSL